MTRNGNSNNIIQYFDDISRKIIKHYKYMGLEDNIYGIILYYKLQLTICNP